METRNKCAVFYGIRGTVCRMVLRSLLFVVRDIDRCFGGKKSTRDTLRDKFR